MVGTKTFVATTTVLYLLGLYLAQRRGTLPKAEIGVTLDELLALPQQMQDVLDRSQAEDDPALRVARRLTTCNSFMFIGRGVGFPIALEGALKLKEISYIHAEGYPAGELKTAGRTYDKVISNIEEARARDAWVIAVASDGDTGITRHADDVFYVPPASELLSPLLSVLPLQLLAYHAAVARGCNVDQPRNLAKSVTVE